MLSTTLQMPTVLNTLMLPVTKVWPNYQAGFEVIRDHDDIGKHADRAGEGIQRSSSNHTERDAVTELEIRSG